MATQRTINEWTHYSVTYDAGQVQWYVNGVATDSGSGALGGSNGSNLTICNHPDGSDPMNGKIYDLSIYNDTLSDSVVSDLYEGSINPQDISSVVSFWPMDERSGVTITDAINGIHGIMAGASWSVDCLAE